MSNNKRLSSKPSIAECTIKQVNCNRGHNRG